MDFSKLRHRIIFLKPLDKKLNGMKENVPVWIPFNPNLDNSLSVGGNTDVYITVDRTGNAILKSIGGQLYAHQLSEKNMRCGHRLLRQRVGNMKRHRNCAVKPRKK